MNKSNGKKPIEKNSKALVIVLIAAVVALAAAVIVLLVRANGGSDSEETETRNILVNEDNLSEVITRNEEEEESEVRALSYIVTMQNTTWTFADGESASPDSWVKNSENNETAVYFDIIRNDTGDTIYQSPVIPVGNALDSVELDTDLEPGTYDCTMVYSLVDEDNTTVLSTVNIALTIIVEG